MTTWRCLDPTCHDGPLDEDLNPAPRLAGHGQHLCTRCATLLERRLADLPALDSALRTVLGGLQSRQSGENKPTKGNPPVPLNIAAHDHLTLMQQQLSEWVGLVCQERDLIGPDSRDVRTLALWLLSQLDWLLAHTAIGDLASEIRDLARTAEGIARTKPGKRQLPVPCPDCGAQQLHRLDGEDHVVCLSCGLTWHERDYDDLVTALASQYLTVADAAAVAGVPLGTFRRWVSEGKVARYGTLEPARYLRTEVEKVQREERVA